MNGYILLMHNDMTDPIAADDGRNWSEYLERLNRTGRFDGGSAIGDGRCFRKAGVPASICSQLGGYLRVRAENIEEAQSFLSGNPVYEAGGTVEIRALPRE
jgi:YCII-related domain